VPNFRIIDNDFLYLVNNLVNYSRNLISEY